MSDRVAVMRNGLFEQLGSAQEIYNTPATSYVARFVGNANVLHHNDVLAAIRSEHVDIVPADEVSASANANSSSSLVRYPARIIGRSFAGGQIRFTALLESGEEITSCRQGIDSSLQNGMDVLVSWDPMNVVPVKDTDT
jgi:spermidine/putrescine transport system ATP-binding protein